MEDMAVHAATPPPEPLAPSLRPSAAPSPGVVDATRSPVPIPEETSDVAMEVAGGTGDAPADQPGSESAVGSASLSERSPPRQPRSPSPRPPSAQSPRPPNMQSPRAPDAQSHPRPPLPRPKSPSPLPSTAVLCEDEIAPLPTSFDPDAPVPALDPIPIDDELAIKPVEDTEPEVDAEPISADVGEMAGVGGEIGAEAGTGMENGVVGHGHEEGHDVQEPMHTDAGADAHAEDALHGETHAHESGLMQNLQDLQDLPDGQEYAHVPDYAHEPSDTGSPLTPIEMSPIPDLPQDLVPVPALSLDAPAAESSSAAAARAAAQNGSAAPVHANGSAKQEPAEDKKRSGEKLSGPETKRKKTKRQVVDEDLGVVRPAPKPVERTQPRAKTMTDQRLKDMLKGQNVELQAQPCMRERYSRWGKCVQCIAKLGGDSCRFRNYRQFPLDPQTSEIIGKGTFPSTTFDGEMTALPREFNTEFTEEHMAKTEQTVAPMLVSLITAEMRHVINNSALTRPVDAAQHRALCDFCAGTIFAGFWFCTRCGRDFCLLCERYISDTTEKLLESPWPLPDRERARIQKCSRGPDSELPLDQKVKVRSGTIKYNHSRESLLPVSRFTADELRTNWTALVNFALEPSEDIDVEERLRYLGVGEDETELAGLVREWFESHKGKGKGKQTQQRSRSPLSQAEIEALYNASKNLPRVADPAELDSHPFMFVEGDRLDNDLFDQIWSRGEPLVVNNLLHRLQLDWSPDEFIRRFGEDVCFVLDCQTEKVRKMKTGQFFTYLKDPSKTAVYVSPRPPPPLPTPPPVPAPKNGPRWSAANDAASPSSRATPDRTVSRSRSPEKRRSATPGPAATEKNGTREKEATPAAAEKEATPSVNGHGDANGKEEAASANGDANEAPKRKGLTQILKLKDWPPTNDFSESYPDLYADFCRALPVPDYTARNGVMNLYSHFPKGATRPDIGPKMYNAFAGRETKGGQGSTRIHMDVADAVNIMLWASPMADGSPGCAVWDLFQAEDADKIRDFLSNKFKDKKKVFNDPIHSQMFYLDAPLRRELYEQKGVKSFRVYQYPGQAVFVPAGCAHQVCNLSDCIKIALDFVSPHNVGRCQQLTQDFRKENFLKAWKDDVLQLYNVMWYAWTNVRETRERRQVEAAQAEAAEAARKAHLASLGSYHHDSTRRYHTTMTSSVRDEPAPSPPPRMERGGTSTPASLQGDDKTDGVKDEPADKPPADLVQRLMDAALARELKPVHIGTDERPYHFAPTSTPGPAPKPDESPAAAPPPLPPLRIRESIEQNHVPVNLAYNVMASELAKVGGEHMDVD